ncbi:helix-turn-helix domain-containing protein [Spirosoma endbachense]|nr:helix-turn-helix domain-containing protein [Spirosoma endbachense]
MIHQRILPHPALQPFVKEYMLFHFVFSPAMPTFVQALPPLPEHGLEFLPKGLATAINQQTGASSQETPCVIFGQPISRINFVMPSEDYLVIRVIFQPGGLFRLLGRLSLVEFTDKIADAEQVFDPSMRLVNEQLLHAKSYPEMIQIIDAFLLVKVRRVKAELHSVDKIGQFLQHNPTRFSLDWLASQACLSPRQVERKFVERMGIGPKLYCRIARFHQAFTYKSMHANLDWLTVAVKFGYTDFQHLSKDIKEFAGVSPNTLLSESALSPATMLGLA